MNRRGFMKSLVALPAVPVMSVVSAEEEKFLAPVRYTRYEGGYWLDWEEGATDIFANNPKGAGGQQVYTLVGDGEVAAICRAEPVHSVRFADGREWDVINGWR